MNPAAPPRRSTVSPVRPTARPARGARAVAPLALAAALLLPGLPARAAGATTDPAEVVGQACAEDDGVTVVVDLTDLGEDIRVGCAAGDPTTGREALERAGFTTTDSVPGMICAVDELPDPCPEEFEGSYWAYFTAEADGEWTARTEGADTADPAPGSFEGWRYNDGSAGPGVAVAEVATLSASAEEEVTDAEKSTADAATDAADAADQGAGEKQGAGPSTGTVVALGAAAVVVVLAAVLLRRRGGQA